MLLEHCQENPTIEYAEQKLKEFRKAKELTSKGGGSTIDVGKFIATRLRIKHHAIPTTMSGSEATRYCVLTIKGKKESLVLNRPDTFEINNDYLKTLPPLTFEAGKLDTYCHATESLWTKKVTPLSILYCNLAKRLLDEENWLWAAHYAGKAIDITQTSIVHALSYGITEEYGIPHGIACGLMMSLFEPVSLDLSILKTLDKNKIINRAMLSPRWSNCAIIYSKEDIEKLWEEKL